MPSSFNQLKLWEHESERRKEEKEGCSMRNDSDAIDNIQIVQTRVCCAEMNPNYRGVVYIARARYHCTKRAVLRARPYSQSAGHTMAHKIDSMFATFGFMGSQLLNNSPDPHIIRVEDSDIPWH